MATNLGELWKKGTAAPLPADLVQGGIGIDITGKKAYSKADDDTIFQVGISAEDYAIDTVGGTLKARLDGTTLYLTNDGSDA